MNGESCLIELELMEAAYSDQFKLIDITKSDGVIFMVQLEHFGASLRFHVPANYPETQLRVNLDGNMFNNDRSKVSRQLHDAIEENPDISSMEICHIASEALAELVSSKESHKESRKAGQIAAEARGIGEVCIARFLIYFHHIRSLQKRKTMCDSAKELSLGGFSKRGYPGVCVIEGHMDDVLEFVRQIQQLRWKQMTVRGEEIEPCILSTELQAEIDAAQACTGTKRKELIARIIDENRRLPPAFIELENMSDASGICTQCGLHDLFVTVMKNYGGGSGGNDNDK